MFFLGKRVPLHTGQLAADLGTLSNTDVAKQILDGSYTFPPDCNPEMADLVMETARLRLEFEDIPPWLESQQKCHNLINRHD